MFNCPTIIIFIFQFFTHILINYNFRRKYFQLKVFSISKLTQRTVIFLKRNITRFSFNSIQSKNRCFDYWSIPLINIEIFNIYVCFFHFCLPLIRTLCFFSNINFDDLQERGWRVFFKVSIPDICGFVDIFAPSNQWRYRECKRVAPYAKNQYGGASSTDDVILERPGYHHVSFEGKHGERRNRCYTCNNGYFRRRKFFACSCWVNWCRFTSASRLYVQIS